ncbi:Bax inhibitor-1/YccA family protein [Dialister sp.]|jgi:FtsH-binding integral membrane protein|uniref:Bax inhibitor-1/YccA family protein n=1 Tax=Dialister sp. TaxID=1955814 RepID=UPI0025CFFB60|nr:Bax inhibitor-1/YccA family protein [Dialister sp.]
MYSDEMTAEREKSLSINMPGLMRDVYAWMAIALVVTGFSAWFVSESPTISGLFLGSRMGTITLIIATFALVWRLSSAMGRMSLKSAAAMFLVYSVLNGITFSAIFLTYTLSSIGGVFFMTAGTFGIMSAYGYVTKADLSKMGNMCLMGLFGIILATVLGFFFDSTFLQLLISYAGILVFTGLTIYDTQSIKRLALTYHSRATDEGQKVAILGALTLYLDFINIFIYLLRLFGDRK